MAKINMCDQGCKNLCGGIIENAKEDFRTSYLAFMNMWGHVPTFDEIENKWFRLDNGLRLIDWDEIQKKVKEAKGNVDIKTIVTSKLRDGANREKYLLNLYNDAVDFFKSEDFKDMELVEDYREPDEIIANLIKEIEHDVIVYHYKRYILGQKAKKDSEAYRNYRDSQKFFTSNYGMGLKERYGLKQKPVAKYAMLLGIKEVE